MSDGSGDHAGVVIFPPLLFVICAVIGALAHVVCPYRLHLGPWALLGFALGPAALLLAQWGKRAMRAAGTNVRPNLPTLAIVDAGPFAYTRNPLYLALTLLYASVGIAFQSPAFLVVLVPMFLVLYFGVVLREERYLDAKFGDAYRGYTARVRRWL